MDQQITSVTPVELGKSDALLGNTNPFTPNTPSWRQWNIGFNEVKFAMGKAAA